jgi:hypothetical protein
MVVVAHQTIGEQFHSPPLMDFSNGVNKGFVVRPVEKYLLSRAATIHDVIDGSGILNAKWPRHNHRCYYYSAKLSTKDLTPNFIQAGRYSDGQPVADCRQQ